MRSLTLIVAGGMAAVFAYNVVVPAEYSIAAKLGSLAGALEANWMDARRDSAAAQTEALLEAEAIVQRRTLATQKAIEAEAEVIARQVQSTSSSHVMKMIGANLADTACGIGAIAGRNPYSGESGFESYCDMGDGLRRSMADDYARALNNARTSIMTDMNRAYGTSQDGRR